MLKSIFSKNKPSETIGAKVTPKKVSPIVSVVAEQSNLPYKEVRARMKAAKDNLGISYYAFAKKGLINLNQEELEAYAAREKRLTDKKLKKIGEIKGISPEAAKAETDRIHEMYGIPFKKYYFNRLYLLTEDEIKAKAAEWDKRKQEMERIIVERSGWDLKTVQAHMKKCDILYGIDSEHYWLFGCWKCNDQELSEFATIDTSTKLSAKFNKPEKKILLDKVEFDKVFSEFIARKHWANRDTTFEEFEKFLSGLTYIFCKPTDSSCGRGASKIAVPQSLEDKQALFTQLMAREKMIVEDCIVQHEEMSRLNPSCVNTVRMISVLENDVCHKVFACMKVGNQGIVDNLISGGGMIVGVDVETGKVITDGLDLQERVFENHPVTGVKIKGFQIPNWNAVLDVVDKAMRVLPGVNYVGWDVVVTQEGAAIIEGNSRPDLGLCQLSRVLLNERIKYLFDRYL